MTPVDTVALRDSLDVLPDGWVETFIQIEDWRALLDEVERLRGELVTVTGLAAGYAAVSEEVGALREALRELIDAREAAATANTEGTDKAISRGLRRLNAAWDKARAALGRSKPHE